MLFSVLDEWDGVAIKKFILFSFDFSEYISSGRMKSNRVYLQIGLKVILFKLLLEVVSSLLMENTTSCVG